MALKPLGRFRVVAVAAAAALVLVAVSVACARADAEITTEIKAKIDSDRNLTGKMMQVDTKKGVVTLTGAAASDAERKRAEGLARTSEGVKDVVDNMTINPLLAPVPTDAAGNAALPSPSPSPSSTGSDTTPAAEPPTTTTPSS